MFSPYFIHPLFVIKKNKCSNKISYSNDSTNILPQISEYEKIYYICMHNILYMYHVLLPNHYVIKCLDQTTIFRKSFL